MAGPALEDGMDGLIGVLDKLRNDLGYGDDDKEARAQLEKHVLQLSEENENYQKYAEEAIREAENLKEANDILQQEKESMLTELNQLKMEVTVTKTQELTQAAYDYDRDFVEQCIVEAESYRQEVQELQERIHDLEEENAGLVQNLSEMRQSQQQLQALQKSVEAGTLGTPISKPLAGASTDTTNFRTPHTGEPSPNAGLPVGDGSEAIATVASSHASGPNQGEKGATPVRLAFNILPASEGAAATEGERGASGITLPIGSSADDPLAVANALAAVAGSAEGGVVAAAARMLRNYDDMQNQMNQQKEEAIKARAELDQLHETITSKTFKAPSAWAEREVKYKQDKRRWEEAQKEADSKISALQIEIEQLRSGIGAPTLEGRIQDLEAQLLQKEREKDAALASLHELQLSMRKEGEWGNSGVRTSAYHGVGMQQMVEQLESASHGSEHPVTRSSAATGATSAITAGAVAAATAERTPESKQTKNSSALAARTQEIEKKLAQVESARAAIEAELAAVAASKSAYQGKSIDWEALRMQRELTLLKKGVKIETAHNLAELESELQQVQGQAEDQPASMVGVGLHIDEDTNRVKLHFSAFDSEQDSSSQPVADSNGDVAATTSLAMPAVREEEAGKEIAAGDDAKQEAIVAEIQEILAAEQLDPVQLGLPVSVVPSLDLPSRVDLDDKTEEQLAPQAVERIHELEAQITARSMLPVTEGSPRGAQPVQLTIAVAAEDGKPRHVETPVSLNIAVKDTASAAAPVLLNIAVADAELKEARIQELEALLTAKKQEEEQLKSELQNLPHVRLQLNVNDEAAAGRKTNVSRHSSGASSSVSLAGYTMEGIAKDRAEADKAWAEHQKNSDGPGLLRAKLELETRCAILEKQVSKLNEALESSEQQKIAMEQTITSAVDTGDIATLATWKERIRSSSTGKAFSGLSPKKSFKIFKRKGAAGAPPPSKEAMATALHDTRDALQETETERNALRRQLARMSEKMKKQAGGPGTGSQNIPEVAGEEMPDANHIEEDDVGADVDIAGLSEDIDTELHSLREENSMLMEQLVDTKLKFAETHGDYLEARRALLRAKEKQMQLSHQIHDMEMANVQSVAHLRPLGMSLPKTDL